MAEEVDPLDLVKGLAEATDALRNESLSASERDAAQELHDGLAARLPREEH